MSSITWVRNLGALGTLGRIEDDRRPSRFLGTAAGWLAACFLAITAGADEGRPQAGDAAPNFEGLNQQGQFWRLPDQLGKNYLVVYFYPGDFTEGCRKQAQDFRDHMNQLAEKGIAVIGVSGDTVATHHLFQSLYQLNFTLLADDTGAVAAQFGVPFGPGGKARAKHPDGRPFYVNENQKSLIVQRGVTTERWTFLIDPQGKIIDVKANVDPTKESQRIIEFLESQR